MRLCDLDRSSELAAPNILSKTTTFDQANLTKWLEARHIIER